MCDSDVELVTGRGCLSFVAALAAVLECSQFAQQIPQCCCLTCNVIEIGHFRPVDDCALGPRVVMPLLPHIVFFGESLDM